MDWNWVVLPFNHLQLICIDINKNIKLSNVLFLLENYCCAVLVSTSFIFIIITLNTFQMSRTAGFKEEQKLAQNLFKQQGIGIWVWGFMVTLKVSLLENMKIKCFDRWQIRRWLWLSGQYSLFNLPLDSIILILNSFLKVYYWGLASRGQSIWKRIELIT